MPKQIPKGCYDSSYENIPKTKSRRDDMVLKPMTPLSGLKYIVIDIL